MRVWSINIGQDKNALYKTFKDYYNEWRGSATYFVNDTWLERTDNAAVVEARKVNVHLPESFSRLKNNLLAVGNEENWYIPIYF